MKHTKFFLAIVAAVLLSGCVNRIAEEINNEQGKEENQPTEQPEVSFYVERIGVMMFDFKNLSKGCESFTWDFGDGMVAYGKDATHVYENIGTYKVTLYGKDKKGYTYKSSQTITIDKPTPYIAGFVLYSIPYEDRYYRFFIKDDAVLPSSWDWSTGYTPLMYNTMLPYTITLSTPHGFENLESHSYYTIQLNRFTSTYAAGSAQCLKQQLKVSDILKYLPEYHLETETGATSIGIIMAYDY